jgi:hypothetical protein
MEMQLLQPVYSHHVQLVKIQIELKNMTVKLFFFSYIDTIDPCSNNSCQNGAACVRSGLTNYTCNCTSGFGGAMCADALPSTSRFEINSKFIYSFFFIYRMF